MKILITGGFGYLGGRLAQFLASQSDHEIVLGSRNHIKSPTWLPDSRVVETLWNSHSSLEGICSNTDAIVHLAGMNAQGCVDDPAAALEVNAVATTRLLNASIKKNVKRFIYLSTAHVYASSLAGIITEETCPVSLHPYATSHRAGEDVVRAAHQRGEIEGVVIRLSNSFGAPAHKETDCWMLLVNDLCRQGLMVNQLVLNSSGMQRRDFITLSDACKAIKHLLEISTDKLGNGLFNVGGAWSPTVLEMTQHIAERIYLATDNKPDIQRKIDQSDKSEEIIDYRVNKLNDTGFNGNGDVDHELDMLIQFCLEQLD